MPKIEVPARSEAGGEIQTETVAGKTISVKRLSRTEAEILAAEMERVVTDVKSPLIAGMIAENFENILLLVESVNHETKQGYRGAGARGSQLTAQLITPSDLAKTQWDTTVVSGASDFISTFTVPRSIPEDEGEIILALMDQVNKPLIDKAQFQKDGDPLVVEPLAFRNRKTLAITSGQTETPVAKLRRVLIAPPESTYAMRISAVVSGADSLEPIGFRIRKAKDVLAL